jgi:NTE family protein
MGAVEGQHLDQMFNRFLMHISDPKDFDDLVIPFHAVATDLETGQEVILKNGSLADAIRASMSVPAFFAPVRLNGRLLVDGGMANNLPISVVREMGADIVIAVDVSSPLLTEEELDSVLSVSEQLSNFLTRKNTEIQIATLGQRDILLVPDLEGVSSADFRAAGVNAELGYAVAEAHQPELEDLSLPRLQRQPGIAAMQVSDDELIIHSIILNNQSVLDDEIILSRIEAIPGEPLDLGHLERNIDQIYALDVFQSVTYSLIEDQMGQRSLEIEALPRSWGPNYLQAGLEFSDDFSGNSDFKVSAAYTRNALNPYGGELRVFGAFGREDELEFNFYQPVDKAARWYVESNLNYRRDQFDIYQDNKLVSELEITGVGASVGLGRNFDSNNRLSLQYNYFIGDADVRIGPDVFIGDDDDIEVGEFVLGFQHDTLDSIFFPTEGSAFNFAYVYANDSLGARFDYQQAIVDGTQTWSFDRNILMVNAELAYSFDDKAPLERWFQLGGFGRLSGLVPDQLLGRQLGLFSLTYMRNLVDIDLAPVYAGITAEAGNVWEFESDISFGDLEYAGSLFLGVKTPVGPVYLAWGYHESGESTLYFYLGHPFGIRNF